MDDPQVMLDAFAREWGSENGFRLTFYRCREEGLSYFVLAPLNFVWMAQKDLPPLPSGPSDGWSDVESPTAQRSSGPSRV